MRFVISCPRSCYHFLTLEQTIESIKNALASKGLDSKQSFAFISFSEDGRVQVHASGQVKGFLDEQSMGSGFQEAYEKAVHDSFIVPEPSCKPVQPLFSNTGLTRKQQT